MRCVAVTGASGLIGTSLAEMLERNGVTVRRIGRGADAEIRWDPSRGILPENALDGVDAVVNLAGAPIARRWTSARKREIRESRVLATALLSRAVAERTPHPVFVSGSAIGYYGDRGDELLDESSASGEGFLAEVVREWEGATAPAGDAGARVVLFRTGVVLAPNGGALAKLLPPFKLGAGGPIGDGRQWMSWIGLHDVVRAIRFVIDSASVRGPVNCVAPGAMTNAAFSRELGRILNRPAIVRIPALALRMAFGEMARETILASQRAVPRALTSAGFQFEEPNLAGALPRELGIEVR